MKRSLTGHYEITSIGGEQVRAFNQVGNLAGVTFPTTAKAIEALMRLGIVRELTGQRRNRVFVYDRYLAILNEGTEPL